LRGASRPALGNADTTLPSPGWTLDQGGRWERSALSAAPDFRVTIEPSQNNGLRVISQVMADKPVTIRRERIGRKIGHLDDKDISRLNIALAFVVGLAD
jgi:hypothetical protein